MIWRNNTELKHYEIHKCSHELIKNKFNLKHLTKFKNAAN